MATISSLLRSAEAARKKQRQFEIDLVVFQWQNSAKTKNDWDFYKDFLSETYKDTTGSEYLTYAKKLKSAEDQYVSAEIQRESIKIQNGTGTKQSKYDKVYSLYERALERGNYDLAQNLIAQMGSLAIEIQNQKETAQKVASTMAKTSTKNLRDMTTAFYKNEDYIEMGDGTLVKPFAMIEEEFRQTGNPLVFEELYHTVESLQTTIVDAYNSATSVEAQDKIAEDFGDIARGEKTFNMGGIKFTQPEALEIRNSARANNPIYSPKVTTRYVQDEDGNSQLITDFQLDENKIDDFIWTLDDEGRYSITETRTKMQDTGDLDGLYSSAGRVRKEEVNGKTIYTVAGENGERVEIQEEAVFTAREQLEAKRFGISDGDNGKIEITDPNGILYENATIMPNGSVRFIGLENQYSRGGPGLYEIDPRNGEIRGVAPDETSDFGVWSEFGGYLSEATDAGNRIIESLAGLKNTSAPRANLSTIQSLEVKDFNAGTLSGVGGYNDGFGLPGTSSLLQSAGTTRGLIQEEELRKQELERAAKMTQARVLQPAQVQNLNQTLVKQTSESGRKPEQLKVWTPKPSSRPPVKVETPKQTRKVTGVTSNSGGQGGFGNFSGSLRVR